MRSRWPLILLIAAIVAVGGRYIYGVATKPDDKTQIKAALTEAVKAAKEGRPGSVIEMLSANFKLNDEQTGTRQVINIVRNNRPEVQIADMDPVITGDSAQITSNVGVRVSFLNQPMDLQFKDVQFQFTKESATEWLIIPTTKWRLSAARVKPEDMPAIPMP